MKGENIICFAKDWSEDPTSNNHVMRMLARENRVLWLNSIATRTPQLSDGRDLRKIASKLASFAHGAEQVDDNLHVYTPIVVPLPHNPLAVQINRQIIRLTIATLRRRLGMDRFQLWSFLPTAAEFVGSLGESLVVYYCTDEWSQFSRSDTDRMVELEKRLCRQADLVFTTSRSLLESKRRHNANTQLALHGVDYVHFSGAHSGDRTLPAEVAELPRPILGFFGLLHDWVDIELVAHLARARPQWSVVLIGKADTDLGVLHGLDNVHLLGRRPYAELPAYCRAFDLGLIPFKINELTRHVNPIKLREYLSAGLPVVSSPLPEVSTFGELCYIAETPEQFLAACERALAEDSSELRRRRREAMAQETWEAKVTAIGDHVLEALGKRSRR